MSQEICLPYCMCKIVVGTYKIVNVRENHTFLVYVKTIHLITYLNRVDHRIIYINIKYYSVINTF